MLGNEEVQVLPEQTMDENDDPVTAPGTGATYPDCNVEPLDGAELTELGRSGSTKGIRVFFPSGAVDFTPAARLKYRSITYNVHSVSFWADDDPDLSGLVAVATFGKG